MVLICLTPLMILVTSVLLGLGGLTDPSALVMVFVGRMPRDKVKTSWNQVGVMHPGVRSWSLDQIG